MQWLLSLPFKESPRVVHFPCLTNKPVSPIFLACGKTNVALMGLAIHKVTQF